MKMRTPRDSVPHLGVYPGQAVLCVTNAGSTVCLGKTLETNQTSTSDRKFDKFSFKGAHFINEKETQRCAPRVNLKNKC